MRELSLLKGNFARQTQENLEIEHVIPFKLDTFAIFVSGDISRVMRKLDVRLPASSGAPGTDRVFRHLPNRPFHRRG